MHVKEFAKAFGKKLAANNISGYAAELSYYLLFALFPFFLFLAALMAYLPAPHLVDHILQFFSGALPTSAAKLVSSTLQGIIGQQHGGLLSLSIVIALWTASSAISALTTSLNLAYGVKEDRPYWKVRLVATGLTLALAILAIAATALSLFASLIDRFVTTHLHSEIFHWLWTALHWPLAFVLVGLLVMMLYYFAPNIRQRWRSVIPGTVFTLGGLVALSAGFSFYVDHFGSYNKTYGSIGAVIVLLMWFYLAAFLLLLGGVVNSLLESSVAPAADGAIKRERRVTPGDRRQTPRRQPRQAFFRRSSGPTQ